MKAISLLFSILILTIGCSGGGASTRDKNPTLEGQRVTKEELELQKKKRENKYKDLTKELEKN